MGIDNITPSLQYQTVAPVFEPQATPQTQAFPQDAPRGGSAFGPAAVLEISPEGRAAYETSIAGDNNETGIGKVEGPRECQTCKNRKYVDGSDDPSVSFQTPTSLSPNEAMFAVPAHEMEHVRNEQMKAESEGRKVVSQSVSIHTSICPECGRVYVSGGETRTVTVADNKQDNPASQGQEPGGIIDLFA